MRCLDIALAWSHAIVLHEYQDQVRWALGALPTYLPCPALPIQLLSAIVFVFHLRRFDIRERRVPLGPFSDLLYIWLVNVLSVI